MDTSESAGVQPARDDDARRLRVVTLVALFPSVVFALPHLALSELASTYRQMYADMGGQIPIASAFVLRATGSWVFTAVLIALDIAVFWLMHRLARRYWVGLVFAPIFYYLAFNAVVAWLMWVPMLQVVTLVQ